MTLNATTDNVLSVSKILIAGELENLTLALDNRFSTALYIFSPSLKI